MTREEALKVLLNEWKCIDRNDGVNCDRKCESCDLVMDSFVLKDAYNMAIKALEQEPKWIPVSERLPEENITVLGTTKIDDIYKTELYDDCGEKKWYANGNFDVPIVAWMPSPESYKSESEVEE